MTHKHTFNPELTGDDVQDDVQLHDVDGAVPVRQDDRRGRAARAQLQVELRLPPRVVHQRLLQQPQTLQHHEGGA